MPSCASCIALRWTDCAPASKRSAAMRGDKIKEQAARDAAAALAEDAAEADLLAGIVEPGIRAEAVVVARQSCILAGCEWFEACIAHCAKPAKWSVAWQLAAGEQAQADSTIAEIAGPAAALLAAERCALNFLGLLSAAATAAQRICDAADPLPVYDTRKTIPLLRAAQKHAAQLGGMRANRASLAEAAIIKENHIRAAGSITAAFAAAREACALELIQVEVSSLAELDEALAAGAMRIMLDNFSVQQARAAAERCTGHVELEASGGITQSNAAEYAAAGVDRISSSSATKNAGCIDLSMNFR